MNWQPIASAPLLSRCLVHQKGYGDERFIASRMPLAGHVDGCAWYTDNGAICAPTAWMPLPPPPSVEDDEAKS